MPVPAYRTSAGTILVRETVAAEPQRGSRVACYARVCSHDQRADLERQLGRLVSWATEQGLVVHRTAGEVGSGLNGRRPKLLQLLSDPEVQAVVVEHRDRLMRFGSDDVEAALRASGRRLIVVDEGEVTDDLVRDMLEVLTSFCARLYGRRSARNRAEKALRAAARDPVPGGGPAV